MTDPQSDKLQGPLLRGVSKSSPAAVKAAAINEILDTAWRLTSNGDGKADILYAMSLLGSALAHVAAEAIDRGADEREVATFCYGLPDIVVENLEIIKASKTSRTRPTRPVGSA